MVCTLFSFYEKSNVPCCVVYLGVMRARGFNLLEVNLALVLFSMILVFAVSIWGYHARIIGKSRVRMMASFLCQRKLEEAIFDGYYNVIDSNGTLDVRTTARGTEIITTYVFNVTVTPDPLLPKAMKIVTVKVAFPDETESSTLKEVTYETKLAKPNKW